MKLSLKFKLHHTIPSSLMKQQSVTKQFGLTQYLGDETCVKHLKLIELSKGLSEGCFSSTGTDSIQMSPSNHLFMIGQRLPNHCGHLAKNRGKLLVQVCKIVAGVTKNVG